MPSSVRVGSFTAFLFKSLRCECRAPASSKLAALALKRTSTAQRAGQRKQFTQALSKQLFSGDSSAAGASLVPGAIVGGVFRIDSMVGEGGMGVVYAVEHTGLHRPFALKILTPYLVNEQTWLRFQAEAKTLATLNHSTFVKVYDLGIHEKLLPFYSMDLLDGKNIEEILMSSGPLSLGQTIEIFLHVLDGLAYAHRNNLIHRDLKPGNIMVCTARGGTGGRTIKILDFGISKLVSAAAEKSQKLTVAGEIFGSPYFMSPEQCLGNAVDARSDIYSIGCTIFETLTSFVPFEGENALEVMDMHQQAAPPSLSQVAPHLEFPPAIENVLARCLAKHPDDRYQSAKELAIDLTRIRDGKEVPVYSAAKYRQPISDDDVAPFDLGMSRWRQITIVAASLISLVAVSSLFWMLLNSTNWLTKSPPLADIATSTPVLLDAPAVDAQLPYFSNVLAGKDIIEFNFPSATSLGVISSALEVKRRQDARSTLRYSSKDRLSLWPSEYLVANPHLFQRFRENDFYGLSITSEAGGYGSLVKAMPYITKLQGLRRFEARSCNLNEVTLAYLDQLSNLTELMVPYTDVSSLAMKNLTCLPKLKYLDFSGNKGFHQLLQGLAGSKNIDTLCVGQIGQPFTDEDIVLIKSCKNLRRLTIDAISESQLASLAELPSLKYINASGSKVTNVAIKKLEKVYAGKQLKIIRESEVGAFGTIFSDELPAKWFDKD